MNLEFPIKVTKELIESKVSQETLMSTYYGVPVKKGLFKAKNRVDNRPTVAYYKNPKGRIIVKDFGSNYAGDWIYVVMQKYQCCYQKALNIAANDFGIRKFPHLTVNKIITIKETFAPTTEANIQVEVKEYTQNELNWWLKYGVTKKILRKFRIFSIKNVFLNGQLFHLHKENQLVFGYFGGIRENIERWRIYFPGKKHKFISNWKSFRLQGAHALSKDGDEYLVITKSLKDVACLYSCGIQAIAPISETCFVTEAQYNRLQSKFSKICLLWDNDYAGFTNVNKFRKSFPNVYVVWLPRKKAKDISDFYKIHGREKTLKMIEYAKQLVNAEEERRNKEKISS